MKSPPVVGHRRCSTVLEANGSGVIPVLWPCKRRWRSRVPSDDLVTKRLPSAPHGWSTITVRELSENAANGRARAARLRRREEQSSPGGTIIAERSGPKTSAPPPPASTQEVSDLRAVALGQLPRLRRAVPLGQGVGDRVDAASPVLRNGRHAGVLCPAWIRRPASLTNWVSRSTDGKWLPSGCSSDTDWRATNASSAMRPGDRTVRRSSVSSVSWWGSCTRPATRRRRRCHQASGQRGSDRLHPTEAEQGPGRAAAPRPLVRRAAASRPPPARHTRQVPRHRHRSRAAIPRPSDSARRSTSPPSDCNRTASLSNAPNSPSSVPRFARQRRSQTQITALGIAPNAVIGEP